MSRARLLVLFAIGCAGGPSDARDEPITLGPHEAIVTLQILDRMNGCLTPISLVKKGDFWQDYARHTGCAFDRRPSRRFWIDRQGRCVRVDESSCGDAWQDDEVTGDCATLAPECCEERDWPVCTYEGVQP